MVRQIFRVEGDCVDLAARSDRYILGGPHHIAHVPTCENHVRTVLGRRASESTRH
jgi:hypothetical protein